MQSADIVFLGNHGVVVCGPSVAYAYDDLYYLERACMVEVLAARSGVTLAPVNRTLVDKVALQLEGERLQSSLFFEALRRTL
jgi:ribulose-5-phosphate 4-epimerase/fuculose-1-phosphate aldolase